MRRAETVVGDLSGLPDHAFGSTSLFDVDVANRKMEIGHTWLGASHRRTAANTEAKRLLLAHAMNRGFEDGGNGALGRWSGRLIRRRGTAGFRARRV